jgi:hypothetical protein
MPHLLTTLRGPFKQDKCINEIVSASPKRRDKYVHEMISAKKIAEIISIVLKTQKQFLMH